MKNPIFVFVLFSIFIICSQCNRCKKPDLKIEDLAVTWTDTEKNVSFKVHNAGNSAAENFMVYVNPEEDPVSPNHRPQHRENVSTLEGGDVLEFNDLDLTYLAHPDNNLLGNVYKIVVLADPKGQIDECDETNNEQSKEVTTD